MKKYMEYRVEGRRPDGSPRKKWLGSAEADMAELEIDKEDVHDRSKWRRNVNVMKRKSNPIGKRTKPIIYISNSDHITLNTNTPTRVPNTTLQQTSSPYITTVSNTLYNWTSWTLRIYFESDYRCEAEPGTLTQYVLALIKKDKPEVDLFNACRTKLQVFLQDSKFSSFTFD